MPANADNIVGMEKEKILNNRMISGEGYNYIECKYILISTIILCYISSTIKIVLYHHLWLDMAEFF